MTESTFVFHKEPDCCFSFIFAHTQSKMSDAREPMGYLGFGGDAVAPLRLPQQASLSVLQALLVHLHLGHDHLEDQ